MVLYYITQGSGSVAPIDVNSVGITIGTPVNIIIIIIWVSLVSFSLLVLIQLTNELLH